MLWPQFELNPFSRVSRAERALRSGRIHEALEAFEALGQDRRLLQCVSSMLPSWSARDEALLLAKELLELRSNRATPAGLADELREQASELWCRVAILARAAEMHGSTASAPPAAREVNEEIRLVYEGLCKYRFEQADALLRDRPRTAPDRFRRVSEARKQL
jgi:hypothetical protein